jgi:hypothetical protein
MPEDHTPEPNWLRAALITIESSPDKLEADKLFSETLTLAVKHGYSKAAVRAERTAIRKELAAKAAEAEKAAQAAKVDTFYVDTRIIDILEQKAPAAKITLDLKMLVKELAPFGYDKEYIDARCAEIRKNMLIMAHAAQKDADTTAVQTGQVADPDPKPFTAAPVGSVEAAKAMLFEQKLPEEWVKLRPPNILIETFAAQVGKFLPWVFQRGEDVFIHRSTGETCTVAAFNRAMKRDAPFILHVDRDGLPISDAQGNPQIIRPAPATLLLDHLRGEVVSGTMYRPDVPARFFEADGLRYLNSFLPESVPEADPTPKNRKAWRRCVRHIFAMYGKTGKDLIRWMAYVVQNPGRKVRWAPLLQGIEGDGKTTIGVMMEAAIGPANFRTVSNEALASDFNSWAEGRMVGFLEEIYTAATGRKHVHDKLKVIITNSRIGVVSKGKDERQVRNVINIMAATNREGAINISAGDRRFRVLRSKYLDRADLLKERPEEYFTALYREIETHPGAIRHGLLSVNLSNFNPNVAPEMTDAKQAMIADARDPLEASIAEVIAQGGIGLHKDVCLARWVRYHVEQNNGERKIMTSAMAGAMRGLGYDGTITDFKFADNCYTAYFRKASFRSILADPTAMRASLREVLTDTVPRGKGDHVTNPPWHFSAGWAGSPWSPTGG